MQVGFTKITSSLVIKNVNMICILSSLIMKKNYHNDLMWVMNMSVGKRRITAVLTHHFLFFFVAFPSYISGVHHFWVRFLRM